MNKYNDSKLIIWFSQETEVILFRMILKSKLKFKYFPINLKYHQNPFNSLKKGRSKRKAIFPFMTNLFKKGIY